MHVDALLCVAGVDPYLDGTSDGIYDSNFIPEIGKNIFGGNEFKPKGTVKAYGDSHPPTEMSFNLSTGYAAGLC